MVHHTPEERKPRSEGFIRKWDGGSKYQFIPSHGSFSGEIVKEEWGGYKKRKDVWMIPTCRCR